MEKHQKKDFDQMTYTQTLIHKNQKEQQELMYTQSQQKSNFVNILKKCINIYLNDHVFDLLKEQQYEKKIQYVENENTDNVMIFKVPIQEGFQKQMIINVQFVDKEKEIKNNPNQYGIVVFNKNIKVKQDKNYKNILFFCKKSDLYIDISNREGFYVFSKIYKIKKQQMQEFTNLDENGFCGISKMDFFAQLFNLQNDELLVLEYPHDDGIQQQIRQIQ